MRLRRDPLYYLRVKWLNRMLFDATAQGIGVTGGKAIRMAKEQIYMF